jgi:hypothetical protein
LIGGLVTVRVQRTQAGADSSSGRRTEDHYRWAGVPQHCLAGDELQLRNQHARRAGPIPASTAPAHSQPAQRLRTGRFRPGPPPGVCTHHSATISARTSTARFARVVAARTIPNIVCSPCARATVSRTRGATGSSLVRRFSGCELAAGPGLRSKHPIGQSDMIQLPSAPPPAASAMVAKPLPPIRSATTAPTTMPAAMP